MSSTRPVYDAVREYASQNLFSRDPEGTPAGERVSPASALPYWSTLRGAAKREWVAANGTALTLHAWEALVRASKEYFEGMAAAQQPDGAWLLATPADSIELRGYDELVLLHAITSYAMRAGRRDLRPAIEANIKFHLRELQPDHATTEPWALHALAIQSHTQPLAEQLMHAAVTQQPQGLHGLPVVLLADALYGLRSTEFFTE